MKTVKFNYQDNEIEFLIDPTNDNVMVNATEMAKLFNKRTDVFLKTSSAKMFIAEVERPPNGGRSDQKIIENRGHMGIYFNRVLALKFAAWLDVKFELWVFSTIDEIIFGHYKKHWEAHAMQEQARIDMDSLKQKMLTKPTLENVQAYFEAERNFKTAKSDKTKAIKQQLNLFSLQNAN